MQPPRSDHGRRAGGEFEEDDEFDFPQDEGLGAAADEGLAAP